MKKILMMAGILSSISLSAQTERFDLANFVAPKGWQRMDTKVAVMFYDSKSNNGSNSVCQIFIYASHDTHDQPEMNFKTEWNDHVSINTDSKTPPPSQSATTPDGWTVVSGQSNVTRDNFTYSCMLVAISGYGKVMSVMVNVSGQDYGDEVKVFFDHLEMRRPEVTGYLNSKDSPPSSSTSAQDNYVFAPPPGWAGSRLNDGGLIFISPVYGTGEKCALTLMPLKPTSGNLQNDATQILFRSFPGFQEVPSDNGTYPSLIRGIAPQGWEYFIVKKFLKPQGNYATIQAFAFVARLGNQLAAIVGSSKESIISNCFGELQNNVWPKFFYSLQFKNWRSDGQNTEILKRLTGVWIAATATAGDRFAFAANGRFAGASAAQRYYATSSNQLLTVTDAYFGDGSYSIKGNQIALTHDNNKSISEMAYFRIEQESHDDGRTWKEKLYLLRNSSVNGAEYELAYEKQNN